MFSMVLPLCWLINVRVLILTLGVIFKVKNGGYITPIMNRAPNFRGTRRAIESA